MACRKPLPDDAVRRGATAAVRPVQAKKLLRCGECAMDTELIEQNVHRLLGAMTGAATTAMVAVGDQLGLYRALAGGGPATQDELAARTGAAARYLREWLSQQAAAGFLAYREG